MVRVVKGFVVTLVVLLAALEDVLLMVGQCGGAHLTVIVIVRLLVPPVVL